MLEVEMKQNDGGHAFPGPYMTPSGSLEVVFKQGGMTMRDYFAAKAMQGILACESDTQLSAIDCAAFAYAQADAMLAERVK
jgi:hypothetical protein